MAQKGDSDLVAVHWAQWGRQCFGRGVQELQQLVTCAPREDQRVNTDILLPCINSSRKTDTEWESERAKESTHDWDINYINQTVWNMTILIMSRQSVRGERWTENENVAEGERSRETDVLSHYGNDLSRTFQWHLAICAVVLQETRNCALKAKLGSEAHRNHNVSKNFTKHFCHSDSMDLHFREIKYSFEKCTLSAVCFSHQFCRDNCFKLTTIDTHACLNFITFTHRTWMSEHCTTVRHIILCSAYPELIFLGRSYNTANIVLMFF